MKSKKLSGLLWNLFFLCTIISKSIDLFIDLDMPLSLIRLVLSNVLIITIWYLLFKRPSVQYRNLEEAVGQKEAVKLEIMANIPYIILIINLFVQKSYIEEYNEARKTKEDKPMNRQRN